ncbi:MAG: lamin tail domain-containing protein [Candidatus Woesearchaeota archaeon]
MKKKKVGKNKFLNKNKMFEKNKMLIQTKRLNEKISGFLIIASFLLLFIVSSVDADIYITQVLYRPMMTTSGGEAVELYNSGNEAVNLSGYTLATASNIRDATLTDSAIIYPRGYFLIADAGWSEKKDSPVFPLADHEQAITMRSTNGGVSLRDRDGNIIDSVGWGNTDGIPEGLVSGSAANYTKQGESLVRINFTGNNALDFISHYPNFTNSLGLTRDISNYAVSLTVNIEDTSNYITNISLPFDFENKIILNPGDIRNINLTFQSIHELENLYIEFMGNFLSYEKEGYDYVSSFSLDFTTIPGEYSIIITARSGEYDLFHNITFIVLPLISFSIDISEINCQSKNCIISEDYSASNQIPSVKNTGNVPLNFQVYADNLTDSSKSINIENVKFSLGDSELRQLTNSPQLYPINLQPNSIIPLSLQVDIPGDIIPGRYTTKMIFMGVANVE